jgi:hypothetical protein
MSSAFEPLVDTYYTADDGSSRVPGRICWAPITYVENDYQVAEVAGTVPSDDSATTYRVTRYTKAHHFSPPVYGPRLRVNEAMRVARMKYRPAVILSARVDPWQDRGGTATRSSTKSRLLVPLYTIEEYAAAFISRVQRFEYNSHFFLPANTLPGGVPDRDVFMRFEESGSVHEYLIDNTRFRLDDEALEYVQAWFDYYLKGGHNEVSHLLTQFYEAAES